MLNVNVELRIYKNGKKILEKESDLTTKWWERVLTALLGTYHWVSDLYATPFLKDEDGATRDGYVNFIAGERPFNQRGYGTGNIKIAIGSGTGTPSLDDYALWIKEYEMTAPSRTEYEFETGRKEVVLSCTFAIDKTVSIKESGLFQSFMLTGGTEVWIMLAHDTFTARDLVAGDSLTVEYRVRVQA